jgi:RHS repeat-associated protein
LTWPSGYKLRTVNGSWQFTGVTSQSFTSLPSGEYRFRLYTCWQETEPGGPTRTFCAPDNTSDKTVLVTRDDEVAVDTATTEAGTTPYTTQVSLRGSASISVPLRTLPGVNGLAPEMSLRYDSARNGDVTDFYRADDTLGYGWYLDGASVITRCRGGLSGGPEPLLTSTDRLCLDGEPLILVSGSYWSTNAEYRTEHQSFIKVVNKGTWFEVRYPDGRVANFGDTSDSRVVASGRFSYTTTSGFAGANPDYLWAIRQVTNGFGDTMTYAYDRFDPYGMVQLKSISYAGATVELKYGPRSDLANVSIGSANGGYLWRQAYVHTVRMRMNGVAVREYRLDSNLSAGYLRLEQVQECGYDESGTTVSCLRPLQVGWSVVSGAASPISLTSLTDGLGASTEFAYSAITTMTNPLTYGETPFGNLIAGTSIGPRAIAVVNELKRSDGLTTAGRQRTTYAYKDLAYASTLNRGFAGFYEVRAKDEQSGVHTYTQTRLDFPLAGQVSQVRQFTNVFPTGIELRREEHAFGVKAQTATVKYVYPLRSTQWMLEGGTVVGASKLVYAPCFRVLSGDTCPSSGTEYERVTQMATTAAVGATVSNDAFTPTVWGDVPDRTLSNLEQTSSQSVNYQNTTSPWVMLAPVRTVVTTTATGEAARTVDAEATYLSGTREPLTQRRLPNNVTLDLLETRTFTGNNLTQVAISGAGITARSTQLGPTYTEDRYPAAVTNAEGHATNLGYDVRFGAASSITDPDGNITAIERDPFGRVIRVSQQDGTDVDTTYESCDWVDCSAVSGAEAATKVTVTTTNGSVQVAPTTVQYVDVRGRTVLNEVEALDASDGWQRQRTVYDNRGRVESVSRPYFSTTTTPTCSGAGTDCTYYTYDVRDRVTREDRPDLGFTTTTFSGATGSVTVTVTETVKAPGVSDVTRAKQSTFNALGQLTATTDAFGTASAISTTYDYDSHGNLDTIVVNSIAMASMGYDLVGNRTSLTDANVGTWPTFEYDALRNLTRTVDAKGQETRYSYDFLNRLTQRVDRYGTGIAVTNAWTWDAPYGTGQLASRSRPGFSETYTYRAADGKLESIDTDIDVVGVHSGSYTRTFGYDAYGRLETLGYPSGSSFTVAYNSQGYAYRLKSGTTVLEDVQDTDAFGQATVTAFANNLKTIRGYDAATGRLTSIQSGPTATPKSIQDLEYAWRTNSTLFKRLDKRNTTATTDDYTDTFSYDALERLTAQTTTGGANRTLDFHYDAYGNFNTAGKTSDVTNDLDVTGYAYGTTGKPHRLTSVSIGGVANTLTYDDNGSITKYDATTGDDIDLVYDGQNNVTSITVGATPTAKDEFWYDPDGQRFLGQETWQSSGTKTAITVYLGNFEEVIPASGGSYNLVQRTDLSDSVRHIRTRTTGGTYASRFEYVHRDHLGSIDVVTDASGTKLNDKLSFDPFGGRRDADWSTDIASGDLVTIRQNEDERFSRGFTDHEMLNRTGFIHMNGRVYDPRIGRFVSADPIVSAPTFSQSYNRYSYVLNNPLTLFDPSGFGPASKTKPILRDGTATQYGGGGSGVWRAAGVAIGTLFGLPPAGSILLGHLFSILFGSDGSGGGGGGGSLSGMASVGVMGGGGGGNAKEGGFLAGAMGGRPSPSAAPERVDATSVGARLSQGGRPDLGRIGNSIRDQVESPLEKDLLEHYWLGRGTNVVLTEDQFGRVVDVVSGLPQPDAEAVSLGDQTLLRRQFGFPPGEFDAAFGTGSVFYNQEGRAIGFYDRYNFDMRWRGSLGPTGKVIGVRAACALAGNCVPFDITYGQHVKP